MNAQGTALSAPAIAAVLLLALMIRATAEDLAVTNAVASVGTIDFNSEIRPIFDQSCVRCHGATRPKGGFRLVERSELNAQSGVARMTLKFVKP